MVPNPLFRSSIACLMYLVLTGVPGRSAEAFVDGDLEIRFTPRPTDGPQKPHQRDEVYIVAAGSGFYRVDGKLVAVGPGDMCFAAAHAEHGFENFTEDFAIWIIFYGPVK